MRGTGSIMWRILQNCAGVRDGCKAVGNRK
jgi:hypothetical protein